MLSSPQIRRRLRAGVAGVMRSDEAVLDETESWLSSVTAAGLLRIDSCSRQFRYDGPPTLGPSQQWTRTVLATSSAAAALASMHPDGRLRERAVPVLAASRAPLSDRALTVRITDHVKVIRETAVREVLRRTTLDQADRIAPLLNRIEHRARGSDVLPLYLHALANEHGDSAVWARLRSSTDDDLRRAAFRQSIDSGLLLPDDVVALLPGERDSVVARRLIHAIVESASADDVVRVLIRGRSSEGRVEGLVKLTATQLDPADVERLLVDRSAIVRLWARRRWQEMGRDPATTYETIAGSAASPIVRARAFTGLAETGTEIGRQEILDLVDSPDIPLRKVGLSLFRGNATRQDIPMLLSLVTSHHSGVARLAGEVLAGSPNLWSLSDLAALKSSDNPELRRRAWWMCRRLGGWEAVIADLELAQDAEPQLAALAPQPVPPMYAQPTPPQRQRLAQLLTDAPLKRDNLVSIATAAGLPDLAHTVNARSVEPTPTLDTESTTAEPARTSRWWFWNRRSRR